LASFHGFNGSCKLGYIVKFSAREVLGSEIFSLVLG
jgi:hypothetical protein